ncbi:MAG: hypothetical protein ACKOUS_20410 [Alphaproteobacteria bacterium]
MDIATLNAGELLRLYRARNLSPVEVTKAVYDRIGALDPAHNAFCVLKPEEALEAARASEARWARGSAAARAPPRPTRCASRAASSSPSPATGP